MMLATESRLAVDVESAAWLLTNAAEDDEAGVA